jgi:hypothetical protein
MTDKDGNPIDCAHWARARSIDPKARSCVSDIDMLVELLQDIPEGGRLVKTGANCPAALLISCSRPDIKFLSIGDGDSVMDHELQQTIDFQLDARNYDCRMGDALEEAKLYQGGPVDLLFLDSNFTVEGIKARLTAWMPHLKQPSWLLMHDWVRYPKVQEAVAAFMVAVPDKTSDWSAAWRLV